MAYQDQHEYQRQNQRPYQSGPVQQQPMRGYVNTPEPEEYVTLGRQTGQEGFPQSFQQSYQPDSYAGQFEQGYEQQYGRQFQQYDQYGQPAIYDQQNMGYDQPVMGYQQEMGYHQEMGNQQRNYAQGYDEGFPAQDQSTAVNSNVDMKLKHKSFDLERDFAPENETGCMYGCIPVKKRSRMICFSVVGMLLVAFGIVGFIFFPRMPTFQVLSINPAPGNSFKLSNFQPNNPDGFSFTMDMVMNLSVINTNFYRLKTYIRANISEINSASPSPGQAIFPGEAATRIRVTTGNYQQPIGSGQFGSLDMPRDQIVNFTMPIQISYTPSEEGAVNDPSLNEMIQLCVYADNSSDRRTVIYYEATNEIAAVRWLGYNPTISGEIRIRCPFQGERREAFIQSLTGGPTSRGGTPDPAVGTSRVSR